MTLTIFSLEAHKMRLFVVRPRAASLRAKLSTAFAEDRVKVVRPTLFEKSVGRIKTSLYT